MMKRIMHGGAGFRAATTTVAFATLLLGGSMRLHAADVPGTAPVAESGAVSEGLQLSALAEKATVEAGEAIYLQVTIKNVSQHANGFFENRPEQDFDVEVKGGHGAPAAPTAFARMRLELPLGQVMRGIRAGDQLR